MIMRINFVRCISILILLAFSSSAYAAAAESAPRMQNEGVSATHAPVTTEAIGAPGISGTITPVTPSVNAGVTPTIEPPGVGGNGFHPPCTPPYSSAGCD
jgi:hypothetical protein